MKKNKGFTFIEILSVVIILSVLFVLIVPFVMELLRKSHQKSFKNEIMTMVENVETAYTHKIINSDDVAKRVVLDDVSYFYVCMSLHDLVNQGFSNKELGDKYGGYIQLWIDNDDKVITFVNATDGRFYLQGNLDIISNGKFMPTKEYSDKIEQAYSDMKCPYSYNIPDKSVFNGQSKSLSDELEDYINNK